LGFTASVFASVLMCDFDVVVRVLIERLFVEVIMLSEIALLSNHVRRDIQGVILCSNSKWKKMIKKSATCLKKVIEHEVKKKRKRSST
jgi:hypothetical protein